MATSRDAIALIEELRPILAGRGPGVQGAALCELVATHIAGHAPELRDHLLALHVETVKELIPVNAKIIRGE